MFRQCYAPIIMRGVPPRTLDEFLEAPLGELVGCWLKLTCEPPCTKVSSMPMQLLAARAGRNMLLRAVLQRLRCNHCRGRAATVAITDHPNDSKFGDPRATWILELR